MKKRLLSFVIFTLLVVTLIFSFGSLKKAKAFTLNDLDRIELYEIYVTPRKDGTLDIKFHLIWKVLDSSSEGPLTWIKVGIPNYHATNFKKESSNIKKIKYYSDEESYIRIDFDRSYYSGEVLEIDFSYNQAYMYHLYEDYVIYDYNPGWFSDCKVDECNLYWYMDGVKEILDQPLAISNEDGYYKLSSPLNYGETIKINLRYDKSFFEELDVKKQYTDKYVNPISVLIRIGIIALIVAAFIILIAYVRSKQDPYMNERGFISGYYHHYWFYGRSNRYYGKTVNAKGARIVNPSSISGGSGGFSGGGGGCACACACACAGGGRAGCSKKDFYHTNLSSEKVLKELEK